MSLLFRTRVASFFAGVAVTSVYAIYQLKRDLQESQDTLINQVCFDIQKETGRSL